MEIVNVKGYLGNDFAAYIMNQVACLPDQKAPNDALIIVPDSESEEQLSRYFRAKQESNPVCQNLRITTPEFAARSILKEAGSNPRLLTTGELTFVIEHLLAKENAKHASQVSARDLAKEIDKLSIRLCKITPGQKDAYSKNESHSILGEYWATHDLALWSSLPGLALLRIDSEAFAECTYCARTVYVLDAQDFCPAALALCVAFAQERLVLCSAEDASCGVGERLRQGTSPLDIAVDTAAALNRDCAVEEIMLNPTGHRSESARVVWETIDEELSGIAAYIWKLLRENPDLEPQDIALIAPNDQWATAMKDSLVSDHLEVAYLPARDPLMLSLRSTQNRDEYAAYLRLRLAADPDDALAQTEFKSIGYTEGDRHIIEKLAQLTGFSIAKVACQGLNAPYMQTLLAKGLWKNVTEALDGIEWRIADPALEAGLHDVQVCVPKYARGIRCRVIIAPGLCEGLSLYTHDQSALHALQRAASLAEVVIFSRPRTANTQSMKDWGLKEGRIVSQNDEVYTMLMPSAAFAGSHLDATTPLIGEQLLSGRL